MEGEKRRAEREDHEQRDRGSDAVHGHVWPPSVTAYQTDTREGRGDARVRNPAPLIVPARARDRQFLQGRARTLRARVGGTFLSARVMGDPPRAGARPRAAAAGPKKRGGLTAAPGCDT